MCLKILALTSCLGGAGALGLRARSGEIGGGGHGARQLPLWAVSEVSEVARMVSEAVIEVARKVSEAEGRRGEGRPLALGSKGKELGAGGRLCNASVVLPCRSWLSEYPCSTTWGEACPGVDSAFGPEYNDARLGASCPSECPEAAAAVPSTARASKEQAAAEAAASRGFRTWSPCDFGMELPCGFWTQSFACSTKWREACPGVDNPAGQRFNDVTVGAACPDKCNGGPSQSAFAPLAPAPAPERAVETSPCHSLDLGHLDKGNYNCKLGYAMPKYCGSYDDEDFTARNMCCECGGGGLLQELPRGAATADILQPGAGPPVAAATLAWPVAAGSQILTISNTGVFSDGDLLEISRGRNRETFVAYFSDATTLHVKAGLKYSYLLGALITRRAEAKDLWCGQDSSYDCRTWSNHFHCSFSYASICPGMDSPYDASLKHVSLQVMCPLDCGALQQAAPPPELPKA